jgi:two-component system chemotaxis sensor kinase CheA
VERGLISQDQELSEDEQLQLVLLPGFSTASEVTGVSGRGVGMDVVKRTIEFLRGTVLLESTPREGTTFKLRLPLTLAIIDGLLVTVGATPYVIPLSSVEECIELPYDEVAHGDDSHLVEVRGEPVPYINLRNIFEVDDAPPEYMPIAITNVEGTRTGFAVDTVVGKHQTVIKSMSNLYRDIRHVSGATILGDGQVALILDVKKILESAVQNETLRHQMT